MAGVLKTISRCIWSIPNCFGNSDNYWPEEGNFADGECQSSCNPVKSSPKQGSLSSPVLQCIAAASPSAGMLLRAPKLFWVCKIQRTPTETAGPGLMPPTLETQLSRSKKPQSIWHGYFIGTQGEFLKSTLKSTLCPCVCVWEQFNAFKYTLASVVWVLLSQIYN